MKLIRLLCIFGVLGVAAHAQAANGFTKIANVATGTAYSDTSCPNQSTCYYQVTSLDSAGFESVPAACSSTTICIGGNVVLATMPSSGTHSVGLTWVASVSTGISYNVYRHIGPLPASSLATTVN